MCLSKFLVELDVCGDDGKPTAIRHGIPGVDGEVHNDLFDLAGVGLDPPQVWGQGRRQRDVSADEPPEHCLEIAHDAVQVEDLGLKHLLAAEGEELARKICPPLSSLDDLFDLAAAVGVLDVLEQHVANADDHTEDVVEIVGDAARQPADRLQFLQLAHFPFHPFLLSHVADGPDEVDGSILRVVHRRDRDVAVSSPCTVRRGLLPADGLVSPDSLGVLVEHQRQRRLRDHLVHQFPDHLLRRQTGGRGKSRIHR